MLCRLVIFCCVAMAAFGANFRLYLKDGTYQMTNEYKVLKDRVSFYSTERGEWEEIPLELIDLDRTKKEVAERDAEIKAEQKQEVEEDTAEREAVKEVEMVPPQPGVYYIHDGKFDAMTAGDSKLVGKKGQVALRVLSPIPVDSKQTLDLSGERAQMRITETRPEFYFRLSDDESFAIIKLTPKKAARIVEKVEMSPLTKEVAEQREEVPTFKKQESGMLYKIWPEHDLDPGEYAVVEYTDTKVNIQVWDFGIDGGSTGDSSKKRK